MGDEVVSRDPKTGEQACQPVVGLKVTPDQKVESLNLVAPDGHTEAFGVTPTHPFWVIGHGWKPAGKLRPGDEVFTSSGGWVRVTGSTWLQARQTVYNFEVARFHTYFVGKAGAWVHNNCADDLIRGGTRVSGKFPETSDPNAVLYRTDPNTQYGKCDDLPSIPKRRNSSEARRLGRPQPRWDSHASRSGIHQEHESSGTNVYQQG